MSFWIGVVVIVLVLETVRIGLSSYLLLHILRAIETTEEQAMEQAIPRPPAGWSRDRDRLAAEAMNSVRDVMDGLARRDRQIRAQSAIRALDAYVLHHQERREG